MATYQLNQPTQVEAIKFTGSITNVRDVISFIGNFDMDLRVRRWFELGQWPTTATIRIKQGDEMVKVNKTDWVLKDASGLITAISDAEFLADYTLVP